MAPMEMKKKQSTDINAIFLRVAKVYAFFRCPALTAQTIEILADECECTVKNIEVFIMYGRLIEGSDPTAPRYRSTWIAG